MAVHDQDPYSTGYVDQDPQETSEWAESLDGVVAATQQLVNMVQQQAYLMSVVDVFVLLTVLFASLGIFALVMKKPPPAGAGAGGH